MSDDYEISTKGAEQFNDGSSRTLGWAWAFEILTRRSCPASLNLMVEAYGTHGAGSTAFAAAVARYQQATKLAYDGKLGAATWRQIIRATSPAQGVLVGGYRFPLCDKSLYVDTESHQLLDFSKSRARLDLLVLHWGGFDADSCVAALANRDFSTHFVTDGFLNRTRDFRVYQTVDIARSAYHVGTYNQRSVGIDIGRSPLLTFADRYPDTTAVSNPTCRGERWVMPLPPAYAEAVWRFAEQIAILLDIPVGPYLGDKVVTQADLQDHRGIVGHHHLSPTKWDVAPWSRDLWPEFRTVGGGPR